MAMSINNQILRRRMKRGSSWTTVCGILTGCAVTLIGVFSGLEPDIILWRAVASGILMSVIFSFGINLIYMANAPG